MFQVNPYHLWEHEQRQCELIKQVRRDRLAREIQRARQPKTRGHFLLRIVSVFL